MWFALLLLSTSVVTIGNAFAFDPMTLVAFGSSSKSVAICGLASNQSVIEHLHDHTGPVSALESVGPTATLLISGSYDRSIRVWNLTNGRKCERTLVGHSSGVLALKLMSSRVLASGAEDGTIKLWRLDIGDCLCTLLNAHTSHVFALERMNGHSMASASFDHTIRVWQLTSDITWQEGDQVHTLRGHSMGVLCLRRLSDTELASGSYDTSVKVWSLESGVCTRTLVGHTNYVASLEVLPGVEWLLASASFDKSVRLWRLVDGDCVRVLAAHLDAVKWTRVLENNGHLLVTASLDKTLRVWNVENGECVHTSRIADMHSYWTNGFQLLSNNY